MKKQFPPNFIEENREEQNHAETKGKVPKSLECIITKFFNNFFNKINSKKINNLPRNPLPPVISTQPLVLLGAAELTLSLEFVDRFIFILF